MVKPRTVDKFPSWFSLVEGNISGIPYLMYVEEKTWFPIKSIILELIDLIDLSGCGQEIILATAV